MAGIPPALDTDAEDVAWALQTAEALWKRGERADAIVWLRRAAQSAGDAQDDDRALVLARSAAELAEWLAQNPVVSSKVHSTAPPSVTSEGHSGVDDLLRVSSPDIPVSFSEPQLPVADRIEPEPQTPAVPPAPVQMRPAAPPFAHPADDEPNTLEIDVQAYRKQSSSAPTAAEAHRGMLDPWAAPPPLPTEKQRTPPPPPRMDDEEVVTSAKSPALPPPRPPSMRPPSVRPPSVRPPSVRPEPPVELPKPEPPKPKPEPVSLAPEAMLLKTEPPEPVVAPQLPAPRPPPLPPRKPPPVPQRPPKKMAARRDRVRKELRSEPPPSDQPPAQLEEEGKVYTADPISMLSAARGGAPSRPPSIPPEGPGSLETVTVPVAIVKPPPPEETLASRQDEPPPPQPQPPPQTPPPLPPPPEMEDEPTMEGPAIREAVARELLRVDLKLGEVSGLSDLPDEEREKLQASAEIHKLKQGEEVGGFALALVVSGDVDVSAQIVDVAADRISAGTVLRGRGTIAEGVPLRLVCASPDAVIATWQAEQIEPALATCPWVVDDLRAQADRIQALVGVTLGVLAERLDNELRRQVTSRLQLRELSEGEVIVEQGQPVRQMLIVGQGHIELAKDGDAHGSVGAGELLFPTEIVSAQKAPCTARAGKGGALVLQADRLVAQELMVTCPPLLEIFGGM